MVNAIAQAITQSVVVENDVVTSVDFEMLDKAIADVRSLRKELKEQFKEAEKAAKVAANAKLAKAGKAFYDSLAIGEEFEYKTADGTVLKARKIETKSNSGKRASCELIECSTKSAKRYPEFHQVIVPVQSVQVA
mgnify:CR=1 FL=1